LSVSLSTSSLPVSASTSANPSGRRRAKRVVERPAAKKTRSVPCVEEEDVCSDEEE
jgi:hypothetical protein